MNVGQATLLKLDGVEDWKRKKIGVQVLEN
jgi:hypothetical protein